MIRRNGQKYEATDIIRRGDVVLLTVGCEKIQIDMTTLQQLVEAPVEKGGYYSIGRNIHTGEISSINGGPYKRLESWVEAGDTRIGPVKNSSPWLSLAYDYNRMVTEAMTVTTVFAWEYFIKAPKVGDPR